MTQNPTSLCRRSALLALLLLSGCNGASLDPYQRTDVWTPEGANAGNLAAMVANPHDLIRGQSDTSPHYKQGSSAVDRLWRGETGVASIGNMGSGGGASGGASAGASAGGSGGAGGGASGGASGASATTGGAQ